ncbi:MAG: hypothetical protein ACOYXB_16705 [Bacteroidota bacterium]
MKTIHSLILILISLAGSLNSPAQVPELKNGFFYLDGEKFFIKGIGYELGARPGEVPWNKTFNPGQLEAEIGRIRSAGFNTIRTWAAFTDEELAVLQNLDIKIIMGIWIDPAGAFSNASFISQAKATVNSVLSYSSKYDNIIAYLIMNEPQPEAIFSAGYEETLQLWNELADLIHNQHPGRPVSIANTCNGTYIPAGTFDFSAYNAYIYNPVTINYLHGYREFVNYLGGLNVPGHPLVMTEFGLSVSPTGPGNWGYGGNTLSEQAEGDLFMYKSLVDGGAAGACIFNYSDGWWKGGNEAVHDDVAEEWFGLVSYLSLEDTFGITRPVWDSVRNFQSAIITRPRSGEICGQRIPVEIFREDTVKRIDILLNGNLVRQFYPETAFIADTLVADTVEIRDLVLIFECYDKENRLIKREDKRILVSRDELSLPSISISINSDAWETGRVTTTYSIEKSSSFETGNKIDYIYYPHIGFDFGLKYQMDMPAGDKVDFSKANLISAATDVFTVGAAFDISYGSFVKRVVNQATYIRPEGTPVQAFETATGPWIWPNPASDAFYLAGDPGKTYNYRIFNLFGSLVSAGEYLKPGQPVSVTELIPGFYSVSIEDRPGGSASVLKLLIE